MKRLDGKTSVPSGQLKHTIVGHSGPQVFDVRCHGDHIPCVHDREVGHAKGRLMFLELVLGIVEESVENKPTDADESKEERDEK